MSTRRPAACFGVLLLLVLSLISVSCRDTDALRQRMFEAEESRAPVEESLRILVDALDHNDAGIRRTAVRALGRLVRPSLVETIAPMLNDPDAAVRREAANALAQSVKDAKPEEAAAGTSVYRYLESRLNREKTAAVRGVIFESIGRLPYVDETEFRGAEKSLLAAAAGGEGSEAYGAAKGFESIYRRNAKGFRPDESAIAGLKTLILAQSPSGASAIAEEESARIRRLSLMALTWAGGLDETVLESASADPDEQVRRLVFSGIGRMGPESPARDAGLRVILRGLGDPSGMVRYEALRLYGRNGLDDDPAPVAAALDDSSPHVALLAIDLLGRLKKAPNPVVARLQTMAAAKAGEPKLAAAHALVALARLAPEAARGLLPDFYSDSEWVVRTYAAGAAAVLKDSAALERLAGGDVDDNVRAAALSGLIALKGRAADGLCLASLERNDYQLILTACGGLKGTPDSDRAATALLAALDRLTAQRRETSRDPRLAILERLGELGSTKQAEALAAYARDFDPLVAAAAAEIVGRWTGKAPVVDPQRLPLTCARLADVEKLRGSTVQVTMAGGGSFDLSLDIDDTPATIARFTALVRDGYYNGLTFHRVVPNFLIQGGSPGANEFMGDGPFMRDESGLESNLRGTVGISTRGRDTGDAQIYINTIDSDRLDHDYCVFGRVIRGMDVVDGVLEADVIEKMEIVFPATKR